MDDLAEFESWHEDFMAWERFQDELERIKGENSYEDLQQEEKDKILILRIKTCFLQKTRKNQRLNAQIINLDMADESLSKILDPFRSRSIDM